MALTTKHKFVSSKGDSLDATLVNPKDWNDDHLLTMVGGRLLGRYQAGAGPVQEVTLGGGLTLDASSGILTAHEFTTGTGVVFYMASAPAGWTQLAVNDYALRCVSGAGGAGHGSISLSQWAANAIQPHVLILNELPSHDHAYRQDPHQHGVEFIPDGAVTGPGVAFGTGWAQKHTTESAMANINFAAQGANWGHGHNIYDFAYLDCILCNKS